MEYKISEKLAALKPSAIREIFKSLSDPSIISFAAGNPSPVSFPAEALSEISADIFANDSTKALQYGITEGYPPLRQAVAARIKARFDIGTEDDETIITSGGQQGIELLCKVLCNEGDAVICENPSFIGALNSFRSIGAQTIGVPLTEEGIDTDILEKTLASTPKAKMLYVIPTFQNPAGTTSTLENRKKVYEKYINIGELHRFCKKAVQNCTVKENADADIQPESSQRHRIHRPENIGIAREITHIQGKQGGGTHPAEGAEQRPG